MTHTHSRSFFAALGLFLLVGITPAWAVITITIVEDGDDVVATLSGTFNPGGLFQTSTGSAVSSFLNPSSLALYIGPNPSVSGQAVTYVGAMSGSTSFGTGAATGASSATGGYFGFVSSALYFSKDLIDGGFSAGDSVSATSTWAGKSFSDLGLTVGNYTRSWSGDSLQLNINASAVPEPSAFAAILGAFVLTGVATRRRRYRSI